MTLRVLMPIIGAKRQCLRDWIKERCDLPDIEQRLSSGQVGAYGISETDALLVLSVASAKPNNARALWIEALGGSSRLGPKKNAALIEVVLRDCDVLARNSGCSEIRIEGGTRTSLKTRLFTKFGFEVFSFDRYLVLRKVL